MNDDQDVRCPFCGEGDFDLSGLKMHIVRGWCEAFDAVGEDDAAVTPHPEAAATATAMAMMEEG